MCGWSSDVSQGSWAVPVLVLMQHLSSYHMGVCQVTGVKIEFCSHFEQVFRNSNSWFGFLFQML